VSVPRAWAAWFGSIILAVLAVAGPAASQTDPPTPIPGPTTTAPPAREGLQAQPPGCTVTETPGDDSLVGGPGPDVLCGLEGNDVLDGREGDDVLDGGEGNDTATFESARCCIRADLATGTATGNGSDQLVGIDALVGSNGDDVLRGSTGPETLSGLGGTDLLYGADGDDSVLGGDQDDYLEGGPGANTLDGGGGADVCRDAVGTSCYPQSPPDGDDSRGILDVAEVQVTLGVSPSAWRIVVRGRPTMRRIWDDGFVVVSFDTAGDTRFDRHALIRSNGRRPLGLLFRADRRAPVGRLKARRPSGNSLAVRVPLERLDTAPERAYYRWAARTIFTGRKCHRVCFDTVPAEGQGALPQPVI
jgi:RTX calcium-binding nonapeptide repeat (4 copies)